MTAMIAASGKSVVSIVRRTLTHGRIHPAPAAVAFMPSPFVEAGRAVFQAFGE
jgi:hypothetical protein